MMYHAHNLVPPAEAAYSNARVLAPRDKRWPYLLGHLYNDSSKVAEAIVAFEAALALDAVYLTLGAAAFLFAFHDARRRGALLQMGE